ncbi:AAA family ATPase [Methanothermococcus sp. Ax23]|uniref:AAA family ATPase n=1 Tax=Methanothermococcus sp. Ax23 TaxID=3156486 RepID=UPI003B9DD658
MIIKGIDIKNFRSHKNTKISFNKGITTIIGQNGSGKSSIFEAMNYALYARGSARIEDLKKRGTNQFLIELTFEIGGNEYKIVRGRGRGSNVDRLYINDKLYAEGNNEVNNKVREILGIDHEVFLNAIYIKQGEISNLINLKPAERKKLIGKLLGIEKYEKTWEEMGKAINNFNGKLEYIKGELKQIDIIKEDINNLKEEISYKEKELKELQNKYEHIKKLEAKKKEELNHYDEKEKKFNDLNKILTEIGHKIETLEKDIGSLNKDLIDINKYSEILMENNEGYIKYNEIEEKLKELSNEIIKYKEYYDKFNILRGTKKNLEDNLKDIENNLKNLNPENKDIETINKDIENIKKELNNLDIVMEKLTELNEINNRLNEINKNKLELKNNEKYYYEYLELNKKLNELNAKLVDFGKLKEKEKSINSQIDTLKKKKEELLKELSNFDEIESKINTENELIKEHDELMEKISNLNKLIVEKETRINQMKEAIEKLKETDNKCPVCQSDIDGKKKEELLNTYHNDIEKEERVLIKLNKKYNNYDNELKELKKKLEEINKLKDKYGKLKEKKENLENINRDLDNHIYDLYELRKEISKYVSIEKEIEDLEKKKNDLEKHYNKYNFCVEYLKNANEKEILENKNNLLKIVGNYDRIKVNAKRKELNDVLGKLNNIIILMNDKKNKEKELIDTLKEIENIQKDAEQYIKLEQKKSKIEKEMEMYEEPYSKYKNALAVLENYCKRYGTDIDKLENTVNEIINNKNKEIESLKDNKKDILEELDNLNYDNTYHNKLKEDYEKIFNKLNDANNQIIEITSYLNSKEEQLQKQINNLNELHDKEKEKERLENYIGYLIDIRENVFSKNGFQQYLREKYIPLIQRYTNEIFNEFELPYSHIQIKNDYDIIVDELPVKTLSGGEQIAVSLALRLGIAKAVCNNLQCIILDEPTAFLDEDRRKKLLNIFGNIKTISQIFVISHHNELEQVANNIINIKKIGEDSVITNS